MNDEGLFGGTLVGMHPRGQRRYAYWPYYLTTHFYSERQTDRQTDRKTSRQTDRLFIYPRRGLEEGGGNLVQRYYVSMLLMSRVLAMGDNEFH